MIVRGCLHLQLRVRRRPRLPMLFPRGASSASFGSLYYPIVFLLHPWNPLRILWETRARATRQDGPDRRD